MKPVIRWAMALCCAVWLLPLAAAADAPEAVQKQLNDRRVQDEHRPEVAPVVMPNANTPAAAAGDTTLEISPDELLKRPDLLVRAMMAALLQNRGEHIEILLPIYRRLPDSARETALEHWAAAVSARYNGQYRQAVRHYRAVLSEQPELLMVRLQLAAALFEDKQFEAAEDQFRRLRSESALPDALHAQIDQYLDAIRRGSPWQFGGGITYLNDKNINNAPKNPDLGNGFRTDPPESGNGIALSANASKKWIGGKGAFGEVRFDTNGKYFWNNKKYNELTARASVGGGFQNARSSIALLPFFEHTWYAGGNKKNEKLKRFSHSSGVGVEASHRLSPHWQGSVAAEYSRQHYRNRPHLNGHTLFASTTVSYLPGARQYWFGGLDHTRVRTRDRDDSYNRSGIRAGWGQEWGKGLSTRITVNYAHKRYLAPNFFNSAQKNREYGVQTALWHRQFHWLGVTPRLIWSHQRNRSNQALYNYQKNRLFIEAAKQF